MKKIIPLLLLALATAASLPTYATPISTTIDLDTLFAGSTPSGSAPWLTATFTGDTTSNTGTLTLISRLNSADFVQGPNLGWGFFLDTGVSGFDCISGRCANSVLSGSTYNGGPTGSDWNLSFEWTALNRFVMGDTAIYNISFVSNLTQSPFIPTPLNKKGTEGNWLSAAHVQGINSTNCSGWIVAGDGLGALGETQPCTTSTNVPEPSALGMFGLGALMIGLLVGLRRRPEQDSNSSLR